MPDEPDFDPTLAPPSDPYVDDTDVTMAADDHSYDPDASYDQYGETSGEVWAGRAGVPPPGTRPGAPGEEEWGEEPPEERNWLLPVIFGVVLVLLLGLLAVGLWLALRDNKKPTTPLSPAPNVTTPAVAPTTAASTPSTPPSSASSASTVSLPNLSGVEYSDAVTVLQGKGLTPKRVDKVSSTVPAGTVISTDPQGPIDVPAGSTVTAFVAVAPPPTTEPASPTASPS